MADQNIQPAPQQKKGFFEKMSLFQKILLFIGVIVILFLSVSILFGGIGSFYQFFFYLIVFVGVIAGFYIIVKATGLIFKPRYFSPREDMKTKIENMAVDFKPDNVRDLFFIGDVGKKRVRAGKIVGLLGLPYYTGDIQRYVKNVVDENGKILHKKDDIVFTDIKDPQGKEIPKYKHIRAVGDGDTLFVVKAGFFLFGKTHFIRCNKSFHSTLNGDVEIFDINPVPYGFFEYPFKQMQTTIGQIMMQNQMETILSTQEHQLDYISQVADASIWFNPLFRMSMKQQAELPAEEG